LHKGISIHVSRRSVKEAVPIFRSAQGHTACLKIRASWLRAFKPVRLALLFSLLLFPHAGASSGRLPQEPIHRNRVRTYYIAADEVTWDYAPTGRNDAMGKPFSDMERQYIERGPQQLGRICKKAIYREYTDARFVTLKQRSPDEAYLGILGPILRAEVGDTIKVFFKNRALRPYSMHPHGLLYAKNSEGSAYNDNTTEAEKADEAVPPGKTHVYVWTVPERSGPGPNDPSSIVWPYHSHVDELHDIASGLFGAIIVTGRGRATADARPVDVDREFVTMMITLNENESWYFDENSRPNTTGTENSGSGMSQMEGGRLPATSSLPKTSGQSNLRHTINGLLFGNMPLMTMKKGERVRWYLMTLGGGENVHTAHWHGNDVLSGGHRIDTVALLPAQVETVDMVPDNIGIWLFHCHVSDHMMGGMATRYQVQP
jgi:FtsP/CotA-like multicopper oxidase with cupredoxin domain